MRRHVPKSRFLAGLQIGEPPGGFGDNRDALELFLHVSSGLAIRWLPTNSLI
jgi:hypothetical protein